MAQINEELLRSKFGFNDPNVIKGIMSDPGQVERYNRELGGITGETSGPTAAAPSAESTGEYIKKRGEEFLTKATGIQDKGVEAFKTGFEDLTTGLTSDLGLDDLRTAAQGLTETLVAMPQNIMTAGRAVGMTMPRIEARMAEKLAKFAPTAQEAQRQYEYALGEFDRQLALGIAPLDIAYGAVGEELRRLETVFSTEAETQLKMNLQELVNAGNLEVEKLKETVALAEAEAKYLSTEFKTIDGRLQLVNTNTGETIRDYGAQSSGNGAPTPIAPKPGQPPTASANTQKLQTLDQLIWGQSGRPY